MALTNHYYGLFDREDGQYDRFTGFIDLSGGFNTLLLWCIDNIFMA